jgi:hypothetical protein
MSVDKLIARYFTGRTDGLIPAGAEELILAET